MGSSRTPVWSITLRLTWLYVASTITLLLLAVGFLYWALERNLDARDYALLASKAQVLSLLLRDQPEKKDVLVNEVEHEASDSPLSYYLRILSDQGELLLETPGMKEVLPVALFPPPSETVPRSPSEAGRNVHSHESFLLLSVKTPVGISRSETRTLHVALDISTDLALLADYRRRLVVVMGLGLLFASAAGGWVARRGLGQLKEITATARHISASQLKERLPVSDWPEELADLASAFNEMLDRLQDSFERLSQFSADLAHSLRSPINNLRGEAEVALARARTPEEYRHVLGSALEEHERLSRMIDGLLFLARAGDPKTAIEHVRFDGRTQTDAVREFYEALAAEQQVTVTCEGHAWLAGDPMLFRRAVSNLLANALRHTPASGCIQIALASNDSEWVDLTVSDTGGGIAPEHLPKVFDRFYRADEPDSHVQSGSGLGLSIVQSIVRLHGGSAQIRSRLGHGTTVVLKFPVVRH